MIAYFPVMNSKRCINRILNLFYFFVLCIYFIFLCLKRGPLIWLPSPDILLSHEHY